MQELVEQMSKNPVPEKAMITTKAIKTNISIYGRNRI